MRDTDAEGGRSGASSSTFTVPFRGKMESSITSKSHLKVMIVGDSMTHGTEGDYTWRYRIWEWLKDSLPKTKVECVGPVIGTVPPPPQPPGPPKPPRLPDEPEEPDRDVFTGGYAKGISKDWKPNHFSQTGRAMWQAQAWIEDTVREFEPDLLLVWLGFNDMAWGVTGPEDTYKNTTNFIANARAAKPDVHFVFGNCPQKPFSEAQKDLFIFTERFNGLLYHELPALSEKKSPIASVAEVERSYGYVPDDGAGTYDTIHPNEVGEYQISKAFSRVLHEDFGIGKGLLKVPDPIPRRPLPAPENPKAFGEPFGVSFTWDPVYGCVGYDVRKRTKGDGKWSESVSMINRVDDTWTGAGTTWEFQARARYGDNDNGDWCKVVSAVSRRETAPPPSNGKVYALPTGFEASWDGLDPSWEVDRYCVLYIDKAGGFLCGKATRETSAVVDDLEKNHKFDVMLQTWTKKGPSTLATIGTIVVGSGVFSRPANAR